MRRSRNSLKQRSIRKPKPRELTQMLMGAMPRFLVLSRTIKGAAVWERLAR